MGCDIQFIGDENGVLALREGACTAPLLVHCGGQPTQLGSIEITDGVLSEAVNNHFRTFDWRPFDFGDRMRVIFDDHERIDCDLGQTILTINGNIQVVFTDHDNDGSFAFELVAQDVSGRKGFQPEDVGVEDQSGSFDLVTDDETSSLKPGDVVIYDADGNLQATSPGVEVNSHNLSHGCDISLGHNASSPDISAALLTGFIASRFRKYL